MKLAAVTMVRNERDVIEAFVRHNLSVVDALAVIDHDSTDGTSDILAALVREGLPLRVERETAPEFRQSLAITRLAREMFSRGDAHFAFALDADEFLKVRSRPALEAALSSLPPHVHALVPWQTYVPPFEPDLHVIEQLQGARRRVRERHGLQKVLVARGLLEQPAVVDEGNHKVVPANAPAAYRVFHARLKPEEAAIAHVPIRSAAQFAGKVAVGWLAFLLQPERKPEQAFHWREAYERLLAGKPLDAEALTLAAANYSVPEAHWEPVSEDTLVADPFLAPIGLLYEAMGECDPMPKVLRFAERLALEIARRPCVDAAPDGCLR